VVSGIFSISLEAHGSAVRQSRSNDQYSAVELREYIGGEENLLVRAAVDSFGQETTAYNPIVFFGSRGTGKSLLAQGLAARWKQRNSGAKLLVLTGAEFAREYRNAVQTDSLKDLRNRYRLLELLVIDDVDDIAGKTGAQTELIQTLDTLFESDSQVIATVKQAPFEDSQLMPSLASRLSTGLTIPLRPPGLPASRLILQRLAELHSIDLSDTVIDIIAEFLSKAAAHPLTVPQLNSTILELDKFAKRQAQPIDEHMVRRCLTLQNASVGLELQSVIKKVSKYFNLKAADLKGPTRRQHVVRARGVAILLARQLTGKSLEQVGRHFGNRDHTTVLHACRKTESLIQSDPAIRRAVDELTLQLSTV
jgi:chromosomal replication initiator protein